MTLNYINWFEPLYSSFVQTITGCVSNVHFVEQFFSLNHVHILYGELIFDKIVLTQIVHIVAVANTAV